MHLNNDHTVRLTNKRNLGVKNIFRLVFYMYFVMYTLKKGKGTCRSGKNRVNVLCMYNYCACSISYLQAYQICRMTNIPHSFYTVLD